MTSKSKRNGCCGKVLVRCIDCAWANLLRYDANPVLAECTKKPVNYSVRHPYDVDVASTPRYCDIYQKSAFAKSIQQRASVRQHPMAAYVLSQRQEATV